MTTTHRRKTGGREKVRVAGARPIAAVLLMLFSSLVLVYLWWGRFQYEDDLILGLTYAGVALCILSGHVLLGDSRDSLGLRLDNLGPALRLAALPTALLAGVILVAGQLTSPPSLATSRLPLSYFAGVLVQQYVLQAFVLQRFRNLLKGGLAAVAASALLFSLLHVPNIPLMLVSLVGGLLWCFVFLRTPSLPVVAVSHLILGLLLATSFKDDLSYFRVGKGGYPYAVFGDGVLVAGGYDASGDPFIATLPGHDRDHPSQVRIFRPDGSPVSQWTAFPEYGFSGNLAVGDLGFGSGDEVVVAPGPGVGNPAEIRVFDLSGREVSRFRLPDERGYGAFVSETEGALHVALGPGPEVPAVCYEMTPAGEVVRRWTLEGTGFVNSVKCMGWPGGRLLAWSTFVSVNRARVHLYGASGALERTWTPLETTYGVSVARFRLGNEKPGLLVAPGALSGHPSHVQVLDFEGRVLSSFHADESSSACGANVGAVDTDGDGIDEIVLGEGNCPGRAPRVSVWGLDGRLRYEWSAGGGS